MGIFSRSPEEITAVLIVYRGESKWYKREALSDLCAEWWAMDGDPDDTSQPPTRIESQISFLEDIESAFAIQGLRYD